MRLMHKTGWSIILFAGLLQAGNGGESDARAVGMARAQVAIAENTEAYLWNPALLGFSQNQKTGMTVQIMGFGFRHGNNVFSISDYNKYNGHAFSDKDKREFLKLFGDQKALRFNGDAEFRALGFQYRYFTLNASLLGNGHVRVPKGLFEMTLGDYDIGAERLGGRGDGLGNALLSVDMSAGYPIKQYAPALFGSLKEVTAGMTLRYIHGFRQFSLDDMFGVVEKSDSVITRGRYEALTSEGGSGLGMDFALAAKIDRQWTVGVSLHNAYSQVRWGNRSEKRRGDFSVRASDIFDIDFRDDRTDSLGITYPDTTKYNSSKSDSTYSVGSYAKKLPMILRVGAGYQLNRKMLLSLDLEQHLNKAAGDAVPRVSAGMEYKLTELVTLRSGMSVGGDNRGFNLAGGAGFILGRYRIDVATGNLEGLITTKRFSFALNAKIDLN